MTNFVFHQPTEVIFGRDIEQGIGSKLKALGVTRVLVHFGGGSARKSGLLDKIEQSLTEAGLTYVELGGVSPNPKLSLVREGIALVQRENVDFLLAVGGGSVIDSIKGISVGVANNGDPWDFITGVKAPTSQMKIGVVLTLAASGSEMSNSCVLTNEQTHEKRGLNNECNRPMVAFLNPENTFSVSPFQTGCGIVDIMMHTFERYFGPGNTDNDLTDRLSEGLLIATRDAGRRAIADPHDYNARATLMWAGSLSHNDLTGLGGGKRLFPVHKLEHELSALHDTIAHGAGLSVLYPAWAMFIYPHDTPRFAQVANRVFGVEMRFDDPAVTAREGILTLRRFFEEIGMPTHLSQLGVSPADYEALAENAMRTMGGPVPSHIPLGKAEILEIFRLAE